MILVIDSSALALLVNPSANPPEDPVTKKPVKHVAERIQHLVGNLTSRDTIIIPAPVLAEVLVQAGEGAPELMASLGGLARIRTRPFGDMAAVETAMMTREAVAGGDKRGGSDAPWQKVKVDRQIVAIARVEGATRIYADDHNLVAFARRLGMDVVSTWDLPLPEPQRDLMTLIEAAEAAAEVIDDPLQAAEVASHEKRAINLELSDDEMADQAAQQGEAGVDDLSSNQLEERQEREFRAWVASELSLTLDELESLDFDVDQDVGNDGAVYGHVVTFQDDCDPEILAKIPGLNDECWVSIGFPPSQDDDEGDQQGMQQLGQEK